MSKYETDAGILFEAVGGAENISAVSHCATRMRFVLGDESLADKKKIEALASVKGMFTNAGQFQVVIGNDVSEFYKDFTAVSGIEGVSKEAGKAAARVNQNLLQRAVGVLAEIFTPLIPAIIVGGLLLGFRNILEGIDFGGATLVEQSQFWSGVNSFLWLPCEAIFHFLPVGICWSVTKKMGTTQILGIILGITLVSPQLLNAYSVASTAAKDVPFWDFGFFKISMIGYQAQVLPALFTALVLCWLEKFWRKRVPEAISMILVPFLSLLPAIILAHAVIGPVSWTIGTAISSVVNAGLTSSFAWLTGLIYGVLYAPLVITGLHHMFITVDMQLMADFGYDNLWPMVALSNLAQGSAVLAYIWMNRKTKKEEDITIPATISCYLGVTEPAMFGINLKYFYPFVAACIGSGAAGLVAQLTQVRSNGIGIGGLPAILAIQVQRWPQFILSMVVAIVVAFALTLTFSKMSLFNKNGGQA
ncbi:hypothetical protein OfM1_12810 [Lactovum odontotermitis]